MMRFFNAHTHIFTLNHVPDDFAKGYFSFFGRPVKISWLKKRGIVRWIVKFIPKLRGKDHDMAERLINIVKHGNGQKTQGRTQEQIFENLRSYYPSSTKYIVLPMDMDYMGAGVASEPYLIQLEQIELLKSNPNYKDILFPFIFADPRRISEDSSYVDLLKDKLTSGKFAGIKMYPALGYWPFDENLEQVYDFAVENEIPIMTHCVRGVVHDRGVKRFHHHPIKTDAQLPGRKSKEYTTHFTHPINFHCIIEPEIISKYWRKPKDYSDLKICLAHFGGAEEWIKYLKYPWLAGKTILDGNGKPIPQELEMDNWGFQLETTADDYGWYSIITAMMRKHKNVYSDVSFMLYERETWPLIKMILTADSDINKRILFGTDFYVVAQKGAERELSIGLRSYLGEVLFEQIAFHNVREYLSSKFIDGNKL